MAWAGAVGSMGTVRRIGPVRPGAFRGRLYARIQGSTPGVHTGPKGGIFPLPTTLAPGASCQAEHAGSFWTVRNDSDAPIVVGASVRVVGVHGLTLLVRPEP